MGVLGDQTRQVKNQQSRKARLQVETKDNNILREGRRLELSVMAIR